MRRGRGARLSVTEHQLAIESPGEDRSRFVRAVRDVRHEHRGLLDCHHSSRHEAAFLPAVCPRKAHRPGTAAETSTSTMPCAPSGLVHASMGVSIRSRALRQTMNYGEGTRSRSKVNARSRICIKEKLYRVVRAQLEAISDDAGPTRSFNTAGWTSEAIHLQTTIMA